jgi:RNA polymerase sigma-70 factor (sigma-E family)
MGPTRNEEFDQFVAARWSALARFACLLSAGDRHRAEDVLQEALVKLWFAWPRVGHQAPEAYLRRVLVRLVARSARRRWWGERPTEQLPDTPVLDDATAAIDDQGELDAALRTLTPRQRAVVVLRYHQDLSDKQVAEVLGCPVGTVRSLASRAVARMREELAGAAEWAR